MPAPGILFFLLDFHVHLQFDSFCFILLYSVIFECYLLEACSFLMRGRKRVDPKRREELRRVEGGETLTRIYGMKVEPIFSKRKALALKEFTG